MLVRVDNEERMEEQQKRKKGVAYTLELRAQEIAALKARITELEGERGRLREVCERLIIAQRFFEVKAGQPGRMPGNDFYSEKFMEVVNMAKSALADPAPQVCPKCHDKGYIVKCEFDEHFGMIMNVPCDCGAKQYPMNATAPQEPEMVVVKEADIREVICFISNNEGEISQSQYEAYRRLKAALEELKC